MSWGNWLKYAARSLVFPGLDLHTYSRSSLCRHWLEGPRDVLDAGCGNGYFSYLAYEAGARVVAMGVDQAQIAKARDYFIRFRKLDPERLSFEHRNLYDLNQETRTFDEIICYETLEHISRDEEVVGHFYRVLKPSGVLHLCCPYALHPRNQREQLDHSEQGGHVRSGYTLDDYRRLLAPIGFLIDRSEGVGNRYVYFSDLVLRRLRRRVGDVLALPLFAILQPGIRIFKGAPAMPFSLYVRARRPPIGK